VSTSTPLYGYTVVNALNTFPGFVSVAVQSCTDGQFAGGLVGALFVMPGYHLEAVHFEPMSAAD
jgi:hypothetical protein